MHRFHFYRTTDVSGVSGTGVVAEGVCFSDGTTVLRWLGEHPSTAVWSDLSAAIAVHGHGGATEVRWYDDTMAVGTCPATIARLLGHGHLHCKLAARHVGDHRDADGSTWRYTAGFDAAHPSAPVSVLATYGPEPDVGCPAIANRVAGPARCTRPAGHTGTHCDDEGLCWPSGPVGAGAAAAAKANSADPRPGIRRPARAGSIGKSMPRPGPLRLDRPVRVDLVDELAATIRKVARIEGVGWIGELGPQGHRELAWALLALPIAEVLAPRAAGQVVHGGLS